MLWPHEVDIQLTAPALCVASTRRYPVALSQSNAHFMLDKACYVNRSKLNPATPLWDAYSDFYDRCHSRGKAVDGYRLVHGRVM